MKVSRAAKRSGAIVGGVLLLLILFVLLFDWNWLRGPIERKTLEKTGRELKINGNLSVRLGWPSPRIRIEGLTFANPPWATQRQMVASDAAEVTFNLLELFRRNYVLSEVRLDRAIVFLEKSADGRKNWLLDIDQQDETARLRIERLTLDHAQLGYDDVAEKTSIRSELSSQRVQEAGTAEPGVVFSATGRYQGEPMKLSGSGGPVLALRDEDTPYPMKIAGTFGRTSARAEGTVTSLLKFSAMDISLELRGENLAHLFPLIGVVFPDTPPYVTAGHLTHSGTDWRYEKFTGRIGNSDIGGTLQVGTAGKRPFLQGELVSTLMDIDDLGPLIGSRPASTSQAREKSAPAPQAAPAATHMLPSDPFSTERWHRTDADVKLSAKTIRRTKQLPLENLVTRLQMKDSVLTLDPLNFGFAGGQLVSAVSLDGRQNPIKARAKVRASRLQLPKLFPTIELSKTSIGQIDGEFDLAGNGNSVARMLATSNGKAGLVIAGGEISALMIEMVGLDLYEILKFKLKGDQTIRIRCGVADFGVKGGVMQANALVFDTEDTNVSGAGSIDLGREALDLVFTPLPKDKSPLVLRGPIHVRGTFVKPLVQLDAGTIAARGLGALVLGIVNPLLAVLPLIETGPGRDSDCGKLIHEAKASPAGPRSRSANTRKQ